MKPSYITALIVGSITGLVLGLSLMLYVGATGGVPSVTALIDGGGVIPVFSAPASALWITLILACAVGGSIIAVATYCVARTIDPDTDPASPGLIITLSAVISPLIGMAVIPIGIVALGSIAEGRATAGTVVFVLISSITGLVSGSSIALLSYILARPPIEKRDALIRMEFVDRSA